MEMKHFGIIIVVVFLTFLINYNFNLFPNIIFVPIFVAVAGAYVFMSFDFSKLKNLFKEKKRLGPSRDEAIKFINQEVLADSEYLMPVDIENSKEKFHYSMRYYYDPRGDDYVGVFGIVGRVFNEKNSPPETTRIIYNWTWGHVITIDNEVPNENIRMDPLYDFKSPFKFAERFEKLKTDDKKSGETPYFNVNIPGEKNEE